MSNINQLVQESLTHSPLGNYRFIVEMVEEDDDHIILELAKPELEDGEYAVARIEKDVRRKLNPRTNRKKKFKTLKWLKTNVPPEERTLKNLPRTADRKAKCKFQDWLMLKGWGSPHSNGQSPNGKCYGWSHRAVAGFYVGMKIKSADTIGNKHTYGEHINKKYWEIEKKEGLEAANRWDKEYKKKVFKPYTIKTEQEAREHAERFASDVS